MKINLEIISKSLYIRIVSFWETINSERIDSYGICFRQFQSGVIDILDTKLVRNLDHFETYLQNFIRISKRLPFMPMFKKYQMKMCL